VALRRPDGRGALISHRVPPIDVIKIRPILCWPVGIVGAPYAAHALPAFRMEPTTGHPAQRRKRPRLLRFSNGRS